MVFWPAISKDRAAILFFMYIIIFNRLISHKGQLKYIIYAAARRLEGKFFQRPVLFAQPLFPSSPCRRPSVGPIFGLFTFTSNLHT